MESQAEVKVPIIVRKGNFIKLNYVGRIKETGKIFDTTIEEIAKKELGDEAKEVRLGPLTIAVGANQVIRGLDEALEGVEVGVQKQVEIPPEKAFGLRDPKLVKIAPAKQFLAQGITPKPGLRVTVDGRPAKIQSVSSGRVIVDLNHELASKVLMYEFKIEEKIESPIEQIRALINYYIPIAEASQHLIEIKNSEAIIKLADICKFDDRVIVGKQRVITGIFKYIPNINKITFVEEYIKPEKFDLGIEALPKPEEIKPTK